MEIWWNWTDKHNLFNAPKSIPFGPVEGLIQTLIMISLHGEKHTICHPAKPELWVDQIVLPIIQWCWLMEKD
jgi:hypothetical protein